MKKFKALLLVLCLLFLTGCVEFPKNLTATLDKSKEINIDKALFNVEYIDVGQGDSELALFPDGKCVLIDGGETDMGDAVLTALEETGVEKVSLIIATHPHSDHIGGLVEVLKSYPVETVAMPYLPDSLVPTTAVYDNFISAADSADCEIKAVENGVILLRGDNYSVKCISPDYAYNDLNNSSAIIMITYGETKFLFTGDAEEKTEKQLLQANENITADVIKIGHHGSETASSLEFLQAVSPKIATISVGENNEYGHPHTTVTSRLNTLGIDFYRTDENGSIIISSDGKNLRVGVERFGE